MAGGAPDHRRRAGGQPCRLAARPGAGRRSPDPVARTTEGPDPKPARSTRRAAAVRDPATKVKGDELHAGRPGPPPAHNEPQDIPLTIVFEDEHLLVVDKPAGLVVHPAAGNRDGTLVNALLHHCAGQPERDRRRRPPGHRPPHRQGHVGPAGDRQDRRGPRRAGTAIRGALDRPALSGHRVGVPKAARARSTRRLPARATTARRSPSSKASAESAP